MIKRFISAAFEPDVPRKKLVGQLVWFLLWLGLSGVGLFLLTPAKEGHGTHTQLGLAACPSVVFFDRPCPGCGMTTSWTASIHGELAQAFSAHWMGPILYFGFAGTALLCFYGFIRGWRIRAEHAGFNKFMVVVLVAFLGYGVVRFAAVPMDSKYSFKKILDKASPQDSLGSEKGRGAPGVPEDGSSGEASGFGQVDEAS